MKNDFEIMYISDIRNTSSTVSHNRKAGNLLMVLKNNRPVINAVKVLELNWLLVEYFIEKQNKTYHMPSKAK